LSSVIPDPHAASGGVFELSPIVTSFAGMFGDIRNVLLARRLEHERISTDAPIAHKGVIEQLRSQDQRLSLAQRHLDFETAATIDTQSQLVVDDHRGGVTG
jgi:hypothetical protein